ncbi:MAG: hypothetical protein J6X11_09765 [Treponema sp.]|nr:hypothetical protein [Treponema sp.]
MNGMEELTVREPEGKSLEAAEKEQLVSVIVDQQKTINRLRKRLSQTERICEWYRKGYETLSHFDWLVINDKLQTQWRDAKTVLPSDTSLKWVCSEGGVESTAFFDGTTWFTERHEKINVKVWQHLAHWKEKGRGENYGREGLD